MIIFRKIRQLVRYILSTDEKSRCSDLYLYACVVEKWEVPSLSVSEKFTLSNLIKKGCGELPSFATVMRERQYEQAENPELSDKRCKAVRAELEQEYRAEYKSKRKNGKA